MDTYNGIFLRHQKVHFKKCLFVLQYTSEIVISNCCFSFKLTSETFVWEVDAASLAFSTKGVIDCNSTW
ncbi:hypothetical protein ES288_A11G026600v1 [Gossypium darwinii]|uniref:Uncharacterized protein n=1 Tax=Gossypium darwinii TaxID=34276 RepID=A0A5D2EGQ4_GOSDA|nr:hypothetical protein ES288_A11G026600v1 [Gossypium darwinii]